MKDEWSVIFVATYLATAGTSYPALILSGPTGTAAVNNNRGFLISCASASKASLSSENNKFVKERDYDLFSFFPKTNTSSTNQSTNQSTSTY